MPINTAAPVAIPVMIPGLKDGEGLTRNGCCDGVGLRPGLKPSLSGEFVLLVELGLMIVGCAGGMLAGTFAGGTLEDTMTAADADADAVTVTVGMLELAATAVVSVGDTKVCRGAGSPSTRAGALPVLPVLSGMACLLWNQK